MRPVWPTAISTEPLCAQLTPSSATGARRERRHPAGVTVAQKQATALDPLENTIGGNRSFADTRRGDRARADSGYSPAHAQDRKGSTPKAAVLACPAGDFSARSIRSRPRGPDAG